MPRSTAVAKRLAEADSSVAKEMVGLVRALGSALVADAAQGLAPEGAPAAWISHQLIHVRPVDPS